MRFFADTESTHVASERQNQRLAQVIILIPTICVLFLALSPIASAQVVHIPDPNLRAAIELALNKETGADITQADMESLKVLQASRCHFLKRVGVPLWIPVPQRCPDNRFGTDIQDLTGLEFAVNLEELHLAHNQISDISPLKALTKLIVLDLHQNFKIADISALSPLTNLTHLSLWGNRVRNVTPLGGLTNLTYLSLEHNRVFDISPLSALTNLTGLDIETNRIFDLSPIKALTKLTYLDCDHNWISDVSPIKDMINLTLLDASDNQISDISPLAGLTALRQLDIDDNQIVDVSPLEGMTRLIGLQLDGNQIVDVSPLKNITRLFGLQLDDNQIVDVSPLEGMTRLTKLDLDHNQIVDVSPLKNLTRLAWLDIDDNKLTDVSALKDLTRLRLLDLGDNEILDVSALKNMVSLTELDLNDNEISDISPLQNMTELTVLDLNGNEISDISPLQNMTELTVLDLHDNQISDVSPLKDMMKLTVLDLSENHILDFSSIAGLIGNLEEYINSDQTDPPIKTADVNRNGTVDVIDLLFVAAHFGNPDFADAARLGIYPDVNGDGVVDVKDLIAVAAEIDVNAAAPTLKNNPGEISSRAIENFPKWITLAKQLEQGPRTQKGIAVLEQILAALTLIEASPKETILLANYPNPFNPETWIPYQLAKPSEVSISIHSVDGKLVRTLELGQLSMGIYHNKSRAAYWDGRNELDEPVASGVYFYTLTAGDFTATGKMLIQK